MKYILWILLFATPLVAGENWPQWRGPNNDGISPSKGVASTWDDSKNIRWKAALPGMGGSTPVIWDDKIFLTSQDDADLVLICINKQGKQLWKTKLGSGKRTVRSDEGNDASPSPSTDGKLVYTMIGTGIVGAYDFDGKEVWKFDAQQRYGKFNIQFGMHSTPVLHGDHLYLQLMHSNGNFVVAINKADGADVWKIDRKSDGRAECEHSYASPVIWTDGKDAYLITHGNDYAIAHSLKDGSEIWRLGGLNPKDKYNPTLRFVASPVATKDLIVVPTAKRGPVVGVKPTAKGEFGPGGDGEAWRMPKGTPDVPSPLVVEGLVFLSGEQGGVTCLDAKTGKEYYTERTHNGRHRASPVYADGKVYMTSRDGVVSVIKASNKFEKISTNRLSDDISASPVISDGVIYIRGWKNLYAIGGDS